MQSNKEVLTTSIFVDDIEIPLYEPECSDFFRRTTLLFGPSDSGKTYVLKDALYQLKDQVAMIFVFAATADSNKAYAGIIPDQVIKTKIVPEELDKLYKRQEISASTYRIANNLKILESLFKIVAQHQHISLVQRIKDINNAAKRNAEQDSSLDYDIRESKLKDLEEDLEDKLIKIYKIPIREKKFTIDKSKLTKEQIFALDYLDFNPNIAIIFDDVAIEIKKIANDKKYPAIKEIFYNGRHNFITSFYTFQDDKDLDSSLRKNGFINVFCHDQCATAYFTRSSNSFPKAYKVKAEKILGRILPVNEKDAPENFKKLVYSRKLNPSFQYVLAKNHGKFRVGCDAFWQFCGEVANKSNSVSDTNPFYKNFTQ